MKKNLLFIHCGMMSQSNNNQGNKGIVLTGTSGCGKTSIMMELITNGCYQYMAEDFGIIGSDGTLYDMQKKAAIYQSDVRWGNPYLKKAVCNLPLSSRMEWRLKDIAHRNPIHFFKPSELFGSEIAHQSQLNKLFFLKRTITGSDIKCCPLECESVAERVKTASFREIKELYELLANIRAVGGDEFYDFYPSFYELEKKYKSLMISAVKQAECYELEVPLNVNPKDTVQYMVD